MNNGFTELNSPIPGKFVLSLVSPVEQFVRARNHAYGGIYGYMYTAHSVHRVIKSRRSIAIKLTTTYKSIEVKSETASDRYRAVLFKPMVPREIRATNAGIVVVVLNPKHPAFRNFSTASGAGLVALNRDDFAPLDERLQRAYLGELDTSSALELLEDVVAIAARQFPTPLPLDHRVEQAIELLSVDAAHDLLELARKVNVSYYRLSHLFSEQMGMSLRTYQLWKKIDLAWRLISAGSGIREVARTAGFTDVTHFCRVFRDAYGVPMSYVLNKVRPQMKYQ